MRTLYRHAAEYGLAVVFMESSATRPVRMLEAAMRPGACSEAGFLGLNESLEEVIEQDATWLKNLDISHEQIAGALEELLSPSANADEATICSRRSEGKGRPLGNVGSVWSFQVSGSLGWQDCPWGCDLTIDNGYRLASRDYELLDGNTGEVVHFPGLLIHLVREHWFFEGRGSPYRVDPTKLVQILQLRPCQD